MSSVGLVLGWTLLLHFIQSAFILLLHVNFPRGRATPSPALLPVETIERVNNSRVGRQNQQPSGGAQNIGT